MKVILVPPRDDWAALAMRRAEGLVAALGENLVEMHHIGSTSIPGIWAKPVIDLMPEVGCLDALDRARPLIEALGFHYWGEYGLPGRRFCPLDEAGLRVVNVHCYRSGHPDLERHLAFRDYLRAHPDIARAYEREKLQCRDCHPDDLQAYNDCKNGWIRDAERDALVWRASGT